MKKLAEKKASELRNNQDLTSQQRQAALEGIRQETEIAIQETLGEEGWKQYNKRSTTYWLDNIHRKPRSNE